MQSRHRGGLSLVERVMSWIGLYELGGRRQLHGDLLRTCLHRLTPTLSILRQCRQSFLHSTSDVMCVLLQPVPDFSRSQVSRGL